MTPDEHPAVGGHDQIGCATHGQPLVKCLRRDLFAATTRITALEQERDRLAEELELRKEDAKAVQADLHQQLDRALAEVERMKKWSLEGREAEEGLKRRAEAAEKLLAECAGHSGLCSPEERCEVCNKIRAYLAWAIEKRGDGK